MVWAGHRPRSRTRSLGWDAVWGVGIMRSVAATDDGLIAVETEDGATAAYVATEG